MWFNQHTLFIASVLSLALQAIAIDPKDLDIQLNDHMLGFGKVVFGSVVTIPGLSRWSDGQIVDLAMVAHKEMLAVHKASQNKGRTKAAVNALASAPHVVSVVVKGDDASIASSLKGANLFYNQLQIAKSDGTVKNEWGNLKNKHMCPEAIFNGLKACDKAVPESKETMGHQHGGHCGEVMAGWAMCDVLGALDNTAAKVIAVALKKGKSDEWEIVDPCGQDAATDEWAPKGCTDFNRNFGWTVIPKNTVRVPVGDLGRVTVRHAAYNIQQKKRGSARDILRDTY